MKQEPIAWTDDLWSIFLNDEYCMLDDDMKKDMIPLYTAPRELSDDELNKAFDYYCETDEGVLRFNYELRDEWKKEQLIRWKEAFKKASEK
jgi:hypothetical protein